jgi:FkbM family methyltransferase
MKLVGVLHRADTLATSLRRVGLGRLTRAGRTLVERRLPGALTVEVDSLRLSGAIRHRGYLHRVATGAYEPLTRAVFRDAVRPGMVVLDVGAHLGLYSLTAASLCGSEGIVHAFEPDPRTFPYLVTNLADNGLGERVIATQQAVSDSSTQAVLFMDDSNVATTGLAPSGGSDLTVLASCVALDDILPTDRRVGVIKLDVEGAELRAIRGMARTIARACDSLTMVVEVHPVQLAALGGSGEELVSELERLGLRGETIDERRGALRPLTASDLSGERGVHLIWRPS